MTRLSPLQRALINQFQGGFPLTELPYSRVAAKLGTKEATLISNLRDLTDRGILSRFGPIYDASRLGGAQTLAALQAPEKRFQQIAEQINAFPEVAHNYRREHRLNMWFVVAASSAAAVQACLRKIEEASGLQVYDFPKLTEFYLGLWLRIRADGEIDTVALPVATGSADVRLDDLDFQIITATQGGLALTRAPFRAVAEAVNVEELTVLVRLRKMLDAGVIRRIGAVPHHYRLGLRGNGMTVWDVPDERAVELGQMVGALDFVSHCYLRPRYEGVWSYNLFAMVHGRERDEVRFKAAQIAELLAGSSRRRDILFSSAVLKKTGLRLAA